MGDKLRKLREKANITQSEAAIELGLKSASTVSQWESGKRKPRVDMLPRIAALYGCSVSDLYGD